MSALRPSLFFTHVTILLTTATVLAVAAEPLTRTQRIDIRAGWNAVYLEVEPIDRDPVAIFGEHPVDVVATYFASKSRAQFTTDPGIDLFRNLGWAVWYRGDRPDAFLTTLDAVNGRRGYLVHASEDFTWEITGLAMRDEPQWRADQFNLVGFPVARPGAPSFAQFFSGAEGPRTDRIYRLADGSWELLEDPAGTPMRSGEAFWMFCDRPTSHSGPLVVETRLSRGLVFADGAADRLVLRNVGEDPLEISIEHLTPIPNPVPLSLQVKVVGAPGSLVETASIAQPSGPWSETLTLEPGTSYAVPFEARLADMTQAVQSSLLKISTAIGTVSWVPATATRSDLKEVD